MLLSTLCLLIVLANGQNQYDDGDYDYNDDSQKSISFCDVMQYELPKECSCKESSSGTSARVQCKKVYGGETVPGFDWTLPEFVFVVAFEYELCNDPASFTASATIELPSDIPNALNTAIKDVVDTVDELDHNMIPLSYNANTNSLALKQTVENEQSFHTSIPFFYTDVAKADLELTLTLSGDMSSVRTVVEMDLCAQFIAELADFIPSGYDKLCASDLPDCTGCGEMSTAGEVCKWIQDHFQCDPGSTETDGGCSEDYVWYPGNSKVNLERSLAGGACDTVGHANLFKDIGSPPWPIINHTFQLNSLCQTPPDLAAKAMVTKTMVTSNDLTDFSDESRKNMKNQLSFTTGAHSSDVNVDYNQGSTMITISISAANKQSAVEMASALDNAMVNATEYLTLAHGIGIKVVVIDADRSQVSGVDHGGNYSSGVPIYVSIISVLLAFAIAGSVAAIYIRRRRTPLAKSAIKAEVQVKEIVIAEPIETI